MQRTRTFLASAVIATLWVLPAHAEKYEHHAAANPKGEVEIVNVAGTLHIVGWDRAEVQVQGELDRDVERVDFDQDSERTSIKVRLRHNTHNTAGAELTVHVPRDSRLTTSTVSADQAIDDVRGAQRLQAISGDIRTQIWNAEFEAKTVSGDIVATGQSAKTANASGNRVRVGTISGSMELSNVSSELDVSSVSGSMSIRASTLSRASIKTTNGDLQLTSALARDARVEAEAINGDLSFNFEGALDAEFEIETFNGDIDNCIGPKAKRKHEHGPGNELRFKEGDGNARVRIKTLNGKVRLCGKSSGRSASNTRTPSRFEPRYL